VIDRSLIENTVMNHNVEFGPIRQVASTRLPTRWGEFQAVGFEREYVNGTRRVETAVALVVGETSGNGPLVRIHSQCLTGDAFGSMRCDCGQQLEIAMRMIAREQRGLLIYEDKEGRGIGLMAKLQAYALQDRGLDTIEANHALGFPTDCRDFGLPIGILRYLGVERVRLLSNNPQKSRRLANAGIEVVERIPCEAMPNRYSVNYLQVKRQRMGHYLTLEGDDSSGLAGHPVGFATIEAAIRELNAGRMIVIVDDADRENEGDLMAAAEMITPETINFMATHGRGLICLAINNERTNELKLGPMAAENTALGGTGFMISIDAKGDGMTTGISAQDRARTIRAAADVRSSAEDFARPGHVFPLRSCPGGVLERRGHTEAAVDLARLAGLLPSGVICEILKEDGTMARVPDLMDFCRRHELKLVTIMDLVKYRLERCAEEHVSKSLDPEMVWPTAPCDLKVALLPGAGTDIAPV
jgi:3,4-dihydroxy-2-butanone 4-phosphate synthase/GTP cyclohydrolase II